jgi:hypothetical protein
MGCPALEADPLAFSPVTVMVQLLRSPFVPSSQSMDALWQKQCVALHLVTSTLGPSGTSVAIIFHQNSILAKV